MKQNIIITLLCIVLLCVTPSFSKPTTQSGSLEDLGTLMLSKALRLDPKIQGGGAKCVGCVLGKLISQ